MWSLMLDYIKLQKSKEDAPMYSELGTSTGNEYVCHSLINFTLDHMLLTNDI